MHNDPFVFAQLVQFTDCIHFNCLLRKYDADEVIPQLMECGDVLQMNQATYAYHITLWHIGENHTCSNLLYHSHLLPYDNRAHDMKLDRNIYEILRFPVISLADKTNLKGYPQTTPTL